MKTVSYWMGKLDAIKRMRISQAMNDAWIDLSNLYLRIESGREVLTITNANQMRCLVTQAYDIDCRTMDGQMSMRDWWACEFYKLPGWLNV